MGLDCYWETENGKPGSVDLPDEFALPGGWFSNGTGAYFRGSGIDREYIAMMGITGSFNPYQDKLTNEEVRLAAERFESALAERDECVSCNDEYDELLILFWVFRAHADAGHVLRLNY